MTPKVPLPMTKLFTPTLFLLTLLVTFFSIGTFAQKVQTQPFFNCAMQMPNDGYIPITVRLLLPEKGTPINAINNFRLVENYLADVNHVIVRFTFGSPITAPCDGRNTSDFKRVGPEIRFCPSSSDRVIKAKSVYTQESVYAVSTYDISPIWTQELTSTQVSSIASIIMTNILNSFFVECSQSIMSTIPILSDQGSCGDGIVTGDEECDTSRLNLTNKGYFSSRTSSDYDSLCQSCKRPLNPTSSTSGTLSTMVSSSNAQTTIQDYPALCQQSSCGYTSWNIAAVASVWTKKETHPYFGFCLPNYYYDPSVGSCVKTTYTTSPVDALTNFGYNSTHIRCLGAVCTTRSFQWLCRSPLWSPLDFNSGWSQCSDPSDSVVYELLNGDLAPDPSKVSELSMASLINPTISRFSCGKKYTLRQVRCGTMNGGKGFIVPDDRCNSKELYPTISLYSDTPCAGLYYVDRLNSVSETVPSGLTVPWARFPNPPQNISYAPTLPVISPNPTFACPEGYMVVGGNCFPGCESTSQRWLQCLEASPADYSPDNKGATLKIITDQTVLDSALCFGVKKPIHYDYIDNRCPISPRCHPEKSCDEMVQCTCASHFPVPDSYLCYQQNLLTKVWTQKRNVQCGQNVIYTKNCLVENRVCFATAVQYSPSGQFDDIISYTPDTLRDVATSGEFNSLCHNGSYDPDHFRATCLDSKFDPPPQGMTQICTDFDQALSCMIHGEAYMSRCTWEPEDEQLTKQLELLKGTTFRQEGINNPASCAYYSLPILPLEFCGSVKFVFKEQTCWQRGELTLEQVDLKFCETANTAPKYPHQTYGCQENCFDPNNLNKSLGTCVGSAQFIDQLSCGKPDNSDICRLTDYNIYSKCQYQFNGKLFDAPIDSPAFAEICQKLYPYSTQSQPHKIDSCFKLQVGIPPLTKTNINQRFSTLEDITRFSTSCQFRPLCQYSYSNKDVELQATLSSTVLVDATVYSTQACKVPIQCNQRGICSSVQRADKCGLFASNALVASYQPLSPTGSRNFIYVDEDEYISDLAQNMDTLASKVDAAQAQLDINELFKSIVQPASCGKIVEFSTCDTNYMTPNCVEASCYLPTETTFSLTIDEVLNDPELRSHFSPSNCFTDSINHHCSINMTDQGCTESTIPVYYACLDMAGNLSTQTCGFGSDTRGIVSRPCTLVGTCNFVSQNCFWLSNNDGKQSRFPGAAYVDSPALCTEAGSINDGEKEQFCKTYDFCGDAIISSSCTVVNPTDDTVRFTLDANTCKTKHPDDFVDYNLTCNNHQFCSSWACSYPTTPNLIPQKELIAPYLVSSNFAAASSFFSSKTGVINSPRCQTPLEEANIQSSTCGVAQIARQVGCLTLKSADYYAQSSFDYQIDATECGPVSTNSRINRPVNITTFHTFDGCSNTLDCSVSGSNYDSSLCSSMSCPAVFKLYNDPITGNALPSDQQLTSFNLDTETRCQASANSTIVELRRCSSLPASTISCNTVSSYCTKNIQVAMGFSLSANITETNGKYQPQNNHKNALISPLSLKYFLNSACTQAADLRDVNLLQNGLPANRNLTLAPGASINLSFVYTFHSAALSARLYLVPMDTTQYKMPYLIQVFLPSLNPRYTVTIPDWVPNGRYMIVVYANSYLFNWIPDIYLTIKHDETLTQSLYDIDAEKTEFPPLIETQSSDLNPLDDTTIVVGVPGKCGGLLCLNGFCEEDKTDPLTPKYNCRCNPGFRGTYCAQTERCSEEAQIANKRSTGEDTSTGLTCDSRYGIVAPNKVATGFDLQNESTPCDTCYCLSNFDQSSGCKVCNLQCGSGTPNQTCTKCTCLEGFSGSQCECFSKQFTIYYRLPPPFIQTMFRRSDPYVTINADEAAQLKSWKASLLADIAGDFDIPSENLKIKSYGSTKKAFGVVIAVKQCSPYPYVPGTDATARSTESRRLQSQNILNAFGHFDNSFKLVKELIEKVAPMANVDDKEGHFVYYKPSFDGQTLYSRFKAIDSAKNVLDDANIKDLTLLSSIEYDDHDDGHDDIDLRIQNDLVMDSLSISASNINLASKHAFSQSNSAMSVTSDASGGFLSFGQLLSPNQCNLTPDDCNPNQPVEELKPIMPDPFVPENKPFDTNILIYIFIPLLFVLIFGAAILLCCSYKNEWWCFKDFQENRKKKRRARREQLRSQRAKPASTPSTTIGMSTVIGSTTAQPDTPVTGGVSGSTQVSALNLTRPPQPTTTVPVEIIEVEEDDHDDDYFPEDMEVQMVQPHPIMKTKRQSIAIGGLKRVSVIGLPPGWSSLMLEGKQIFVNTDTMQSSSVRPNPDGTIPDIEDDKGW